MFKHTGIVRRLDDLGRVVIPKEIRRKFRVQEGDPLEIGEGEDAILNGNVEGALIIPVSGVELTESDRNCLKLCAGALSAVVQ